MWELRDLEPFCVKVHTPDSQKSEGNLPYLKTDSLHAAVLSLAEKERKVDRKDGIKLPLICQTKLEPSDYWVDVF